MDDFFITLAILFLLGLGAYWLGLKTAVPSVTLLIVIGIGIGPSGLDLFAHNRALWFPVVSNIALVMLGFLMGGALTLPVLREQGIRIFSLSVGVALGTFTIVFAGLLALGQPLPVAILLAGIATATDPAATASVLVEQHQQHSPTGKTLTGIVALDDAWGLLIFSFCLVVATGAGVANGGSMLITGLWEIFGAIILGVAIGLPMAYLTGRICSGEPTLVEALGLVFLCAGLAFKFEVSHLLAAIVMGATVANLAKHHNRPFHAIEGIEWPFLLMFFILAGASLEMTTLLLGGVLTLAYCVLRLAGKLSGGAITSILIKESPQKGAWMGFALLPQAGVAVALALTASQALPAIGDLLLTVTLASTVVFEFFGPVATKLSIRRQC
ncbi:MAG: cation:proton antiporter [Porticoccaceae bacterium]|nr:cation:proton antiporter [Porticoccaceae bacterium]